MPSEIEEMPSGIEKQHPPPPEKKRKIEGVRAEEKEGGEKGSIDEKEASELEGGGTEEEDSSDDEGPCEWVVESPRPNYMKYYEDKKLSERLLNLLRSPPEHHPDEDYLVDGQSEVNWEIWNEYHKQIEETEGFGVEIDPGDCENAFLKPIPFFKKSSFYYDLVTELADLAIKEFNRDNIGKEFKLVDVERVVTAASRGILYLLTFTAEDAKEGVKTFEAKVLDGIGDEREVELCRIKKQEPAA